MNDIRPSSPPPVARREDALPPVQPPSASFLIQLFLIPMIIVSVVIAVWLGLHWMAHMGSTPREMVERLKSLDGENKKDHAWQVANDLAVVLQGRDNGVHRRDAVLAQELASILQRECQRQSPSPERLELRVYLCTALGQFEVPDGLPALLEAADPQQPYAVRQVALEALALLGDAKRLGPTTLRENTQVLATLQVAATTFTENSDDVEAAARVRSRAAYALGVVGGPPAIELLLPLLGDPHDDTRHNAAAGLARQGDLRSLPQLLEMLQPEPSPATQPASDNSERIWKKQLEQGIGLSALEMLQQQGKLAARDLESLRPALETLAAQSDGLIRMQAQALITQWSHPRQTQPAP